MAYSFSVQLYAVRTEMQNNPLYTLRRLRDMGYTGVEGFGNPSYAAYDVKYALSDAGLKLVGTHIPWEMVQDDRLNYSISYLKSVDCKYAIVPGLPGDCTESIDAWKRTAERFNALSKRFQAEGINLGYHNHSSEFKAINGEVPFFAFFDNTDPAVVVQIDNGNALSGGADIMEIMRRYPGRTRSVHLKPYSKNGGFAPVIGEDDINWPEFLHWCRDSGNTEHYVVEYEDEKTHPQMEGVELCIKALKEMEKAGKI